MFGKMYNNNNNSNNRATNDGVTDFAMGGINHNSMMMTDEGGDETIELDPEQMAKADAQARYQRQRRRRIVFMTILVSAVVLAFVSVSLGVVVLT